MSTTAALGVTPPPVRVGTPVPTPVVVAPQTDTVETGLNEQGKMVGAILKGAFTGAMDAMKQASVENGADPADVGDLVGSVKGSILQELVGKGYPLLVDLVKVPLTAYDTPEIMAERKRQIDFEHQLIEAGGPISTYSINTPERIALRDKIVDTLYGTGAAQKGKEAWVLVGMPAAGKSTLSEPLARDHGALDIDSDAPLDYLPEWQKDHPGLYTDEERTALENRVVTRAEANGDNVILNFVPRMGAAELQAPLQLLKDKGYKTHLILLDLPTEKGIERAVKRFESIGRFNDPLIETLLAGGPQKAYEEIKHSPLVDTYAKYSTDVPKGTAPILMEEGSNK